MPHIIIEYPRQVVADEQLPAILNAVHESVVASGLFESGHIKTRAYPIDFYTNAGGDKPYMHTMARIKSGRNPEQKKQLSEAILSAISGQDLSVAVITVEVIDMDRDSYTKFSV